MSNNKKAKKQEIHETKDAKQEVRDKLQKQTNALFDLLATQTLNNVYTKDAYVNQLARLGYGQPNIAEATEYPLTRMSYNYNLFVSIYRGSWIARKIIDVLPADMLKNWIKIVSGLDPTQIKKIKKAINVTNTIDKLKEGLQWGRLFGGAIGLILIDGEDDILDQPLNYDTIMPDSYKGILIFDRWNGVYPSQDLVDNICDSEYGLPEYYMIDLNASKLKNIDENNSANSGVKVHHSRILRFAGRNLPFWEKQQEWYWGESEIEIIFDELKKRDNTSFNIASLIFLANIRVLKMDQLGQTLAIGNEEAKKELYNVIEAQNELMNNMSLYVMDKDDSLETHEYSFSGLDDIYQSFMLDVAGAAEMPVTKIFGREPSGFNSTGESDMRQYNDTVEEKQRTFLTPILEKLLPIICISTFGAIPEDFDWEYNSVQSVDNKDLADLAGTYTDNIINAFNAGIIDKEIALKELKQQSELTGMWTNISDEYIKKVASQKEEGDLDEEDIEGIQNEISPRGPDLTSDDLNENDQGFNQSQYEDGTQETWRDRVTRIFMNN